MLVSSSGIESLIGAGANIINLNKLDGITYMHEVSYNDHMFVAVTERPYVYFIERILR